MSVRSKFEVLLHVGIGYWRKWMIDLGIVRPRPLSGNCTDKVPLVVSLTSYGRRVEKGIVYYSLVSLLRQSLSPDVIVVWLDKERWSEENLPRKLKKLTKYGVEFRFCMDCGPGTKLIPALELYGDDCNIVTVDDDLMYRKDMLKCLVEASSRRPTLITACKARYPKEENGSFKSYVYWPDSSNTANQEKYIMPLGVSGVLYPPRCLHKMAQDVELLSRLSRGADDIWFWIMAKLNGVNHQVVNPNEFEGDSFDVLYQFFHKGSALTHSNNKQHANDTQLANCLDYFNIELSSLENRY